MPAKPAAPTLLTLMTSRGKSINVDVPAPIEPAHALIKLSSPSLIAGPPPPTPPPDIPRAGLAATIDGACLGRSRSSFFYYSVEAVKMHLQKETQECAQYISTSAQPPATQKAVRCDFSRQQL